MYTYIHTYIHTCITCHIVICKSIGFPRLNKNENSIEH